MSGASSLLAMKDFQGTLSEDSDTDSIGTSASEIFGNDPERVFLLLINLSANDVYIGFNPRVSASNGIFLGANGGSMSINAKDDYTLTGRAIYAVAGAANSNLYHVVMRRASSVRAGGEDNAVN